MALVDSDCTQCTVTAAVPMTEKCAEPLQFGKNGLIVFYNCAIAKTLAWASAADVITDLVTGTNAVAIEATDYTWVGDAPEVVTIGNRDIVVTKSYTLNATSLNRQADNTDYDFWNKIYDWANKGLLRIATLSINEDFRDYNPFSAKATEFNDTGEDGIEKWIGSFTLVADVNGKAGGYALKPARFADGSYELMKAEAYLT